MSGELKKGVPSSRRSTFYYCYYYHYYKLYSSKVLFRACCCLSIQFLPTKSHRKRGHSAGRSIISDLCHKVKNFHPKRCFFPIKLWLFLENLTVFIILRTRGQFFKSTVWTLSISQMSRAQLAWHLPWRENEWWDSNMETNLHTRQRKQPAVDATMDKKLEAPLEPGAIGKGVRI